MSGLMLGLDASDPQFDACERWSDDTTDTICFGGAKYGGKSYLGANLIFADALTYPGTTYFIAREKLNDLRKFTRITVGEVFKDWKLDLDTYAKWNGQDNFYECHNGSKVFFLEGAYLPSDPLFERFGSMQFTRGWIEEGGEFSDLAIENLCATVGRWRNGEYNLRGKVLITCNPKKNYLYREFYKPWSKGILPPTKAFIRSLATDNINGNPEYIEKLRNMRDPIMRARLWEGNWEYEDDPFGIFPYDAVADLWTNEHVPHGDKGITVDVGYNGANPDLSMVFLWSGWRLIHITKLKGADTKMTSATVRQLATQEGIPMSKVVVDATGIGAGVVDQLGCVPFIGASKPMTDGLAPVHYANLRAQCYAIASEIVKDRAAYIETPVDREDFEQELCQIRKANVDDDRKYQIEAKDEIRRRLGRSPDRADPFSMRAMFELTPPAVFVDGLKAISDIRRYQRATRPPKAREDGGFTTR